MKRRERRAASNMETFKEWIYIKDLIHQNKKSVYGDFNIQTQLFDDSSAQEHAASPRITKGSRTRVKIQTAETRVTAGKSQNQTSTHFNDSDIRIRKGFIGKC